MTPYVTVADALRREGQEQSQASLTEDQHAWFLDHVRALPAGAEISVNDLRPALDAREIPKRARGGMFYAATTAGLLEPLYVRLPSGREIPAVERSTGRSAHGAMVQIYVRTAPS